MTSPPVPAPPTDTVTGSDPGGGPAQAVMGPGPDSELTWLLHRAAQRMNTALSQLAAEHGLTLRDHIVLSALHRAPGLTQIELGHALGMDKTTLTAEVDRLEKAGLVSRQVDPRDRRARIPVISEKGDAVRSVIATGTAAAEMAAVGSLADKQVTQLRAVLYQIIGTSDDPGSCI